MLKSRNLSKIKRWTATDPKNLIIHKAVSKHLSRSTLTWESSSQFLQTNLQEVAARLNSNMMFSCNKSGHS